MNNKRRFAVIILIALLLTACSGGGSIQPGTNAAENTAAQAVYSAKFVAEAAIESENLNVLFMQGSYSIDKDKGLYSMECSQVYFGEASAVKEYYEDGMIYSEIEGEKVKYEATQESLFSFLYLSPPIVFSDQGVKNIKQRSNGSNVVYAFDVKGDYTQQLTALAGENIYRMLDMAKPLVEKTQFSDIYCEYILENQDAQLLDSYILNFKIKVYETPGYSPNYAPREENYSAVLTVKLKISYTKFGEVEIVAPDLTEYN